LFLAGAGLAVQRGQAHPPHQRDDVLAAHDDAFQPQQIAQHATARERHLQMQFVDAAHQP